jgi:hypothetical protein
MKNRLMFPLVLVAAWGVACSGDGARRGAQQNSFETVQEGSAAGVTSTIHGPGEVMPAVTGTNSDTTTAFALDPNAVGTAPPPVTASVPTTTTPPPAAYPIPQTVAVPVRQPPPSRPVDVAPAQPAPRPPPDTDPAPPTETAEPTEPAPPVNTDTVAPEQEQTEEPEQEEPQEEEPPPPTTTDTRGQ